MSMQKNALVGKRVAVHPLLTTDPIGYQGHVGVVLAVDENAITVIFDNTKTGAYVPDGLLVLLPKETLLRDLVTANNIIKQQDCKLILQVCSFLEGKRHDEALKLAIANDTTRTLCTITCEVWLQRRRVRENKKTRRL
jgi:hypothetical protein